MVVVDPEFKNVLCALTDEEYQGLRENIKKIGYIPTKPIDIWNGLIVDGHNRYAICQELDIEFTVHEMEFDNRYDVIDWIIDHQKGQRNIVKLESDRLSGVKYNNAVNRRGGDKKNIKEKVSQLIEEPKGQNDSLVFQIKDGFDDTHRTAEKIAKEYDISPKTVIRNAVLATDIDIISQNTGIEPQQITSGNIKVSKTDISKLAEKSPEVQKEIIEKVIKKEVEDVKTALNKIDLDNNSFDDLEIDENYADEYDLGARIFNVIEDYVKEYKDTNINIIKLALELVNRDLTKKIKVIK